MKNYDLVVIGAGSGGLAAATEAKAKGLKVALLEKNKIGGECTHYGCIPSKAFLHSSKMYEATKHLEKDYGLNGMDISWDLNFSSVMERVERIIQKVYETEKPNIYESKGIDVFIDKTGARFIDSNSVQIGSETLHFKKAIICTGSSPKEITSIPIATDNLLNNVNFWSLRKLPESIIFIGGGIIAAELGQALARFGTQVTIVDSHPEILHALDKDVRKVITEIFTDEGIRIVSNAELKNIGKAKENFSVTYFQDNEYKKLETERIFISIGRKPNLAGLVLEKAGIEYSEKGIQTNDYQQTNVSHIYACGDVATSYKFSHVAEHQAKICIHNILNQNKEVSNSTPIPWVIFTEPEIAHVGLTEKEAKEKFGDKITVSVTEEVTDRFVTDSKNTSILKILFDSNGYVIGADAIGTHAGEWIQLLTFAIVKKISAEDISNTIFAYPTYSEIVKKACKQYLSHRPEFVGESEHNEHAISLISKT